MTDSVVSTTLAPDRLVATGTSRMNLSLHHLFAACRFTARIGIVEHENKDAEFSTFWEEILQYSLAVATLSVASIEGYANELYFEGAAIAKFLNPAAADAIAASVDDSHCLQKYDTALAIREGKRLDFGCGQVQNVQALIKLRNAVVHFRPEWSANAPEHDKLSRVLRYKFEPSPFLKDQPLFPMAWASHSFAEWAIRSTVTFVDYFHEQAEIPSPLKPVFKERLTQLSGVSGL